jgi:hypothetical protein
LSAISIISSFILAPFGEVLAGTVKEGCPAGVATGLNISNARIMPWAK